MHAGRPLLSGEGISVSRPPPRPGADPGATGWYARLRRHVLLALALKLALLALLFFLFFSAAHRPAIAPGGVSAHLHLPR
jgi:hypothetical protein